MANRETEVCTWALSDSQGWVKLSNWYYTDDTPTICNARPQDTVLVREYISSGAKQVKNYSDDKWNCGVPSQINNALAKFGNDPQDAYL